METLAIERNVWIRAPLQRVWQAITEPAQLEQWYAPGCPWEIPALQAGAMVQFYNTDTDIQRATIEVLEPLHQLTLRWQFGEADPEMALVSTYHLQEANDGTQIRIVQSGYETLPEEIQQQTLDQDADAYTAIAEGLKAYLEG
jgi:uncharacterized protein YndB with AHSA1/START domain